MKTLLILAAATGALACLREIGGSHLHTHVKRQDANVTFPPVLDANEHILVNAFDNTTIDTWSYYYAHSYHLAGTNQTVAQWTADKWAEHGFTSRLEEYFVYLNYPVSHSLTLTYTNGSTYTPSLQEAVLAVDETTSLPNRIPTFHGYSPSGTALAEYVYVGVGQQADFERLVKLGVDLKGKIALAKYGGPFRGLKVKNAQEHGMVAAVIFTDPGDDHGITEANGYAAYPDGPARNPTTVQRGSVQFLSTYPGDPSTPGYPSKPDSPRVDRNDWNIPDIPSLPISWIEAQPLLKALNGHGTSGKEVNRTRWIGAIPGADYSTGVGSGATLSLSNVMKENYTTIWNAISIINGTNQDEVIIIGNHRDAWIIGGASDPNSGTAVLVELSKAFGKLLSTGWKPTRTIILASWDAEEYGCIGSTEWVEEYIPWLTGAAVTYLNVDVAVAGPYGYTDATPDLHALATATMKKVIWPLHGATQTYYDVWRNTSGAFGVLGGGSDYVSFVHSAGISSLDTGAGGAAGDPVYHYHSNYDSYHWMSTFGDPGFHTHKAVGQYVALLAYNLASSPILPLEPADYVPELRSYLDSLRSVLAASNATTLDLVPLETAISTYASAAEQFNALRQQALLTSNPDLVQLVNHKARDYARGFTSQGGLEGREYYKNLLFAPGLDTGYAPVTFPGVTESVTFAKSVEKAQVWVRKTAKAIERAAQILAL